MFVVPLPGLRRSPALLVTRCAFATLILLGCGAGVAAAQTVDTKMWITNPSVSAIATAGNTVYLAGDFTYVGPNTGHFVAIDVSTGAPEPGWPKVDGDVLCSAP